MTVTSQPVAVQLPDIDAGDGVGCTPLQAEPEIAAETLPVTLVAVTVPAMVPLIEQLLHVSPENGKENDPFASTFVIPDRLCDTHPGGPGGFANGMLLAVNV